ncbi:hypothetical protein T4C_3494 [Trichinella pseudospiralis]|uniref:Uncharacterized protein n=1 Tax=Trichinella pseudospiralis TaxID=6337 RepID=A0A0V1KFU3_TRIPS|nr:hypothetical protein T4C_3494 [Trichinella pseudospiralis]
MSFVQNRVESIQQLLELGSWRQLPKRDRPRICSRGTGFPGLSIEKRTGYRAYDETEIPSVKVLTALVENTNFSSERYEYFDHLLRISAYCTRLPELLDADKYEKGNSATIKRKTDINEQSTLPIRSHLGQRWIVENCETSVILSDEHPTTATVICRCHLRQPYGGCETTLAVLQQRYCIFHGKQSVKRAIQNCLCCRRNDLRLIEAKMSLDRNGLWTYT